MSNLNNLFHYFCLVLLLLGTSNMGQTLFSDMESWNFLFFSICLCSVELGYIKQKQKKPQTQPWIKDLYISVTRWMLECPTPMFFSTTLQERPSPSEMRSCMVLFCCVAFTPAWSYRSFTFGLPLVIFSFCILDVGFSSLTKTWMEVLNKMLNVASAGGCPTVVCSVQHYSVHYCMSVCQGCCSLVWCIKQS